jgi:ABC-type lipopolysaccharide export system ATPase subunit
VLSRRLLRDFWISAARVAGNAAELLNNEDVRKAYLGV